MRPAFTAKAEASGFARLPVVIFALNTMRSAPGKACAEAGAAVESKATAAMRNILVISILLTECLPNGGNGVSCHLMKPPIPSRRSTPGRHPARYLACWDVTDLARNEGHGRPSEEGK